MVVSMITDGDNGFRRWLEANDEDVPSTDVQILTSSKRRISAHSTVLAYSSPVLESILMDRPEKRGKSERTIRILGVPFDAVQAFIRFLYSGESCSKESEEEMRKYNMHLLVLSHVYSVGWLKRSCERAMATPLAPDNVVDILVLARRCDAPWLQLRCMKLLSKQFKAVEKTEAWKFLQENDPFLELDILQSLQEAHVNERRRRKKRWAQKVYIELSEAMECLRHICTEGCTDVGPCGRHDHHGPKPDPTACPNKTTCHGLQQLMRHFFVCDRKTKHHSCNKCNKLWQLLRLHASICDCEYNCKVPLCMQFKERMENGEKVDEKWRLLVKKVRSVRVMSYLAKRKRQDEGLQEACL